MRTRLLEEHAERCVQLAYDCQNKTAERFFRLLAVDLMLAAEHHRPRHENAGSEFVKADQLTGKSNGGVFKPESASTI